MSGQTKFKLYEPQRAALMSPAKELLYGGAVGGGKSYLARVASITFSLQIPGLITYLFRRTFKEVLANHIHTPGGYLEMLSALIDAGDVVYSKSDYSFTFYNGSRIQLAHAQHESDVYLYQGAQIGFLIIDESTHFTQTQIRFLRSRVRLGSLELPEQFKNLFPRILYTANPGGPGHHYFKSNFVDFGMYNQHLAPDDDGGMLRMYIPAKLSDNKVLMKNDPDYPKRVLGLGDVLNAQAMLDGDWESLMQGGFGDLWTASTHVVKPFRIPVTWKIDRAYDYGSSAPAACIWFAEADGEEFAIDGGKSTWVPKGTIFVIKECYIADSAGNGLRKTPEQQAKMIKQAQSEEYWGNRVKPGPADNAIFSAEPGKSSIAEDMEKEGVTFVRGDKSPGSRIQGVSLMRMRLAASLQRPAEKPGIYFFSSCYNTIRTLPNLQNDDKNIEDIDTSGEDHIWDAIRYRLLKAGRMIKTGKVVGN